MSGGGGLHAREIDCSVLRLQHGVRWLGVVSREELPELSREIRPWCLILNTDLNDHPGTHWHALYAPIASNIELLDSFGLSPRIYSLDLLDTFHVIFSSVA